MLPIPKLKAIAVHYRESNSQQKYILHSEGRGIPNRDQMVWKRTRCEEVVIRGMSRYNIPCIIPRCYKMPG